jgi:predicted nucleotide-binding protein (sugar kinase/HSP70/actin superfamily)
MAKPKRKQLTAGATKEKTRHNNPFVQAEAELIEAQLTAIADGLMKLTTFYTSFKEELISQEKREKSAAISTPEKPRRDRLFVQVEPKIMDSNFSHCFL